MEDDFDNGKERIGAFISLRRKVAFWHDWVRRTIHIILVTYIPILSSHTLPYLPPTVTYYSNDKPNKTPANSDFDKYSRHLYAL
jgi:hypothetical protein